jgi:hypothetical protein
VRYIISIIAGLVTSALVVVAAIDGKGELVYSFDLGTHISDFVLEDTNERMTFINYMKYRINNRKFSLPAVI